ncbi:MAG: DUF2298 domain-containing protein [Betaproteobacteria bacterium]
MVFRYPREPDMNLIFTSFSLLLVLVNIAGLTAALGRFLPTHALGRAAGITGLVLVLFFIEHFVGLGRLGWVWPLSTAASLFALYRKREKLSQNGFWQSEAVFLAGFSYALLWRLSFPSIFPSSERVTNLYFIQSYINGDRLPPPDLWFPPLRFDFYYALQHYAAALLGRVFDLSAGLSYNIAFCVLMALPITLAWDFASRFLQKRAAKLLIVATLAIGGTGATPFVHLVYERTADTPLNFEINDRTWGGARFVGGYDQKTNTTIGKALFPPEPPTDNPELKPLELPSENYGYQFALGDYHPPSGGFFLLLLALALIGALEVRSTQERTLTALLALTVPLQLAVNTWVFPLQGILVLAWALWRQWEGRPPDWIALFGGGVLGGVLLYPFLATFSQQPTASAIHRVEADDHTPWRQFVAALWPVMVFIALGLLRKEWRRVTLAIALACLAMLVLSEFIFVDDPTGGQYQRTNTTMKWWGYLNTLNLAGLGVLLLSSSSKITRSIVVLTCLTLNVYTYDLFRYWWATPKTEFGQLRGDGVYTRDPPTRELLRYLEAAPDGIVMESLPCGAFCDAGVHALFAGKPLLLGWPMHVQTWRVTVGGMWIRKDDIDRFYSGKLAQPAEWLGANDVRYVVWTRGDARHAAAWQTINAALGNQYAWREFGRDNGNPIGLWVRSGTP